MDGLAPLIELLLTEQRASDPAAARPDAYREPLRTWLAAAAALAAGEPKRALTALDRAPEGPAGHAVVTRALRTAATALEHDWFPGGTSDAAPGPQAQAARSALHATAAGTAAGIATVADPGLRLAAVLAGRLLPDLLSARRTVGHGMRASSAYEEAAEHDAARAARDGIRPALRWFDALREDTAAGGRAVPAAYHSLLAADLRVRAADPGGAKALRRDALRVAPDSLVVGGFSALLVGDWELGAPGAAERCSARDSTPGPRAPARAEARYKLAEERFRAAGSARGQAAALLRIAHAARVQGRTPDRVAALERALALATEAGDGACAALLRVHRSLDRITAGQQPDPRDVEAVLAWTSTVGSGSWGRGLVELVTERAVFLSGRGDAVKSRNADLLAERLTGAPAAGDTVCASARAYASARHRLASLVLTDLRLRLHTERLERGEAHGPADRLGVVRAAATFHSEAVALMDPDLIAASRPRFEQAIAAAESLLPFGGESIEQALRALRAEAGAVTFRERLHRSRRARAAGLEADADRLAERALRAADGGPDAMARCVALIELRRFPEARAELDGLVARGEPSAVQEAVLRLRLRQPRLAAAAVREIGTRGPGPADPWGLPALEADVARGRGDHATAVGHALRAIARYEEHRVKPARDALRAASADSPVVAGMYHTAIMSLLALGGAGTEAAAAAAAFGLAERSRSGFLDAVHALDGAGPAVGVVRAWLQAETRWSAQFEDVAEEIRRARPAATPGPTALRRVTDAERALDAAQADVARLAPAAFVSWRGGTGPDAAAVADALPPDTVLLEYHLFDEDLVGWAMTRDGLRVARTERWAHGTVATARRFHSHCARAPGGEDTGRQLSELLLRPFRTELDHCERVIVVPPARLSLLPFHALPWRGDVLGAGHDVSYLPAASLLTRPRPPDRPWKDLAALLVGAPATDPRRGLADLPGTAAEVAEIARLLPGHRVLTGAAATRERVLREAAGCGVLHLATHGDVDELAPNRTRLALAGPDALGLPDLLGPGLDPQLLVLSACDTGRGTATAGGDVLGLTRAAMITGARHAVVSLWPVDDDTGALVVTRTYRHLADGTATAVGTALTLARREVRDLSPAERAEEFAGLATRAGVTREPAGPRDSRPRGDAHTEARHPCHWAPFIHVGV
ncbi:CHAT domain-containing protein [Streptomyces netropsis]|uniref:CHAT domain-containing protein n=2 Tax=Streptomyces netropsis TaxID=55404 RepID=A0A7W7L8Y3_STRNE|nr:CHAT domain-containing protein [Streptomyces netropsis]MBB4885271.1 CHAT domain-containing protein [Streptomyces netropsis]